jgi:predicted dithiol-disulfide oxidoreductase (DUF899 family)
MATAAIEYPRVVSEAEWLSARIALLAKEKELTRARDAVNAERRRLPWVRVEKEYVFDTVSGPRNLAELFDGRSQLIVYHFMWRHDLGEGCVGCSYLCDHIDGANQHLRQHDVSLVAVARAPLATLQAFQQRMGWQFPWVSSYASDFNFDYHVSFRPEELATGEVFYNYRATEASIEELSGFSVFFRNDEGEIFHTYSSYGRGNEEVVGAYMYLDMAPKGRNETGPGFNLGDWVRHHDRYGKSGYVDPAGGFIAQPETHACCASDHSAR